MAGADIRIAMPPRNLGARARLVWHGWNVPYWQLFFASRDSVRQRLTSIMQGYLVVATLLVVMAFPTLFSLLAIKGTDQRDTRAYKVCIFFLGTGCLTSLASIFMLTSALAVASLPDDAAWPGELSGRMLNLLAKEGITFYASILCYTAAIPSGFFIAMHRTVAAVATAVFALIFAVLALMFGYYQGDLLEVLGGASQTCRWYELAARCVQGINTCRMDAACRQQAERAQDSLPTARKESRAVLQAASRRHRRPRRLHL